MSPFISFTSQIKSLHLCSICQEVNFDGRWAKTILVLCIIPDFLDCNRRGLRSALVGYDGFSICEAGFLCIDRIMSRNFHFFNSVGIELTITVFIWKIRKVGFPVCCGWNRDWFSLSFAILIELEFHTCWAKPFLVVLVIPNFWSFKIDILDICFISDLNWDCFGSDWFSIHRDVIDLFVRIIGDNHSMFCFIQLVVFRCFGFFERIGSFC